MNVPVLINRADRVIAGHGRIMACQQLGWTDVPTISLEHLTEAQARAFMIADNRLTENSEWDERLLAEQLKELWELDLDFDLEVTGFEISSRRQDIRAATASSVRTLERIAALELIPYHSSAFNGTSLATSPQCYARRAMS
jgi:ParB-like chromosome segregation protein Spo0J